MQLRKNIPGKIIDDAELKLVKFKSLEKEINAEMVAVVKQALAIRLKISRNMKSDGNPDGLLTRTEDEYMKCL